MKKEQIEFTVLYIGYIDSGEKSIFLDTVSTENQIFSKHFHHENKLVGIFYSCIAYGTLRLHISFDIDHSTDKFNEDIASCVIQSLEKSGMTSCLIWVRNENRKVINFLKEEFRIPPEGKYYYASMEFIMRRVNFNKFLNTSILEIRPYEEKHIDKYLTMLDNSMTYISPPPNYLNKKEHYLHHFDELKKNNSFESFWRDDKLIGLYWRKKAEIEVFAVDIDHQRKGFGTIMLTQAIEKIFKYTTEDYVYLYAVDWNEKGQSFYRKYGMEENGHSYLLRLNNFKEK
jgi:GNAT superfamily N-acetyltransferase